jgi:hypothetical protein
MNPKVCNQQRYTLQLQNIQSKMNIVQRVWYSIADEHGSARMEPDGNLVEQIRGGVLDFCPAGLG